MPHPGAQTEFLARPEFEVLFGGSAGPGKTDCLVAGMLRDDEHPRPYKGLILRRTFPQLQEIIDRCWRLYPALGGVFRSTEPAPPEPSAAERPTEKHGLQTAVMRSGAPELAPGSGTLAGRDLHQMGVIELPRDRRFSLAVIQGAATGQIHQITKSRTLIGRAGADIELDDPECSRQHAVVEIVGEHALVRHLGSTNGTFLDTERITSAELGNHMEFRVGSHVLMFIVTEVE